MISVAHLNQAFPRLMACFGPSPGAAGAPLMLLIQAVITFSHRNFSVSTPCLLQTFNYSFFPLSCYPSLFFFAYLSWSPCLIFHLLFGFFSSSNSCVSRHLSDLDKDPEDQTLSPSLDYFGITPLRSIFSPPFAPADFSAPPSSCHKAPWCLFCYRMRNKNVVPLLLLIYLPCPGE